MRKVLTATVLLLLCASASAWTPKVSFGLEWGYTGTFLRTYQYNYIYSAGSRITEDGAYPWYYSNGSVLANVGLDISPKVNLSVYSGLLGVYSRRWFVPIELRARWCPHGLENDGPVLHAGEAVAFPTSVLRETGSRTTVGGGYRFMVYKHISVDFLMSFNLSTDHTRINDPDTGEYISRLDMVKNNCQYWGINASVAINF